MINTIKNKFFIIIFLLSIIVLLISGCSVEKETLKKDNEKIQIITTLFPQYDFAKKVGGDRVDVKLLIPPGVEAHSFEPTPRDMVSIEKADIFIYTNEYMEPWAVKIAENVKSDELIIIDASKDVELMDIDGYEEHDHHDDHDHGDKDPHIWTDPIYAKYMVNNIVDGLIKSDPENSEFYIKNGEDYKKELDALHKKIKTALEKTQSNKIIYGGHFAFGYFAKRYNLEYISPYVGFSPNAEPNPQKILELIKNLEESGTNTIFYEELIEPKVAKILSKETNAQILLLHAAHNVSKEELESNLSYIDIMEGNLERLKEGLGYNE